MSYDFDYLKNELGFVLITVAIEVSPRLKNETIYIDCNNALISCSNNHLFYAFPPITYFCFLHSHNLFLSIKSYLVFLLEDLNSSVLGIHLFLIYDIFIFSFHFLLMRNMLDFF